MNGAAVTAMCVVAGLLVTGGDDGSLRLFNPTKGDCLQSFRNHQGAIMDIHAVRSYLVNQTWMHGMIHPLSGLRKELSRPTLWIHSQA